MFDAVVLIGSRSAEAPVGLAVTIWALLLFVLNTIIQLLIIAVVVMILKAEKDDIDEVKILVTRQDINAMHLRQVTGKEEHERIGVRRFPSKL
jgi:hypothetical protein